MAIQWLCNGYTVAIQWLYSGYTPALQFQEQGTWVRSWTGHYARTVTFKGPQPTSTIAHVSDCLTGEGAELLVYALVTSRLDHCNALLFGVPTASLRKLYCVKNTAARI